MGDQYLWSSNLRNPIDMDHTMKADTNMNYTSRYDHLILDKTICLLPLNIILFVCSFVCMCQCKDINKYDPDQKYLQRTLLSTGATANYRNVLPITAEDAAAAVVVESFYLDSASSS